MTTLNMEKQDREMPLEGVYVRMAIIIYQSNFPIVKLI